MGFLVHQMRYTGGCVEGAEALRNYTDEDYEQYARIYNEAFAPLRTALGIEPVYCCEDRKTLLNKKEHLYVLEEDGLLVGSVGIFGSEIDDLVVDASCRNKGCGTRLLRFAVQNLQSEGISPITLHAADWNQGALRLYLRNGFEIVNTEWIEQ